MIVDRILPKEWREQSEAAHTVVFGKRKPASWDRLDFILVAGDGKTPAGYVSCREHDAETVYWQFGGSFPGARDTLSSFKAFSAFVEWTRPKYKRATCLIENDNLVMLKMAMKVGFRIVGVRCFEGKVLLEHLLSFSKE